MRLKARVAAVVVAGTAFVCVAPASAQQTPLPTCADFPTQIDMENSVFPPTLDPSVFDPDDDGVGCEENPGPPVPYDVRVFPPAAISNVRPLEVSPTSGPAGTVITVHGEGCIHPREVDVLVELIDETNQDLEGAIQPDVATDGSWTAQLTVPAEADPDHPFDVIAVCSVKVDFPNIPPSVVGYESVPFDVTEPTTNPPVIPPPTAPPAAPPAAPVVAEPTFTG
jgi:hypothetical protein